MCVSLLIIHWKEPLQEYPETRFGSLSNRIGNRKCGRRGHLCLHLLLRFLSRRAKILPTWNRETTTYGDAIRRLRQESSEHLNDVFHQAILNLTGHGSQPWRLIGEAYNEEVMLPVHVDANDKSVLSILYLNKTMLCYFFRRYDDALE